MFEDDEIQSLSDMIRFKMRNTYYDMQETLEENLKLRGFDFFPDAFTYEQERVLYRISEELFNACNELCISYCDRAIKLAFQLMKQDEGIDL